MAIYCMKCGKELPDDAAFCIRCGNPQSAASAAPQAASRPQGVVPSSIGAAVATRLKEAAATEAAAPLGTVLLTYKGHPTGVSAVAWSPNGRLVASAGGDDNAVQIWDATTGERLGTYTGHAERVRSVAWSPDSRYVASAHTVHDSNFERVLDEKIQVWEAATGQQLAAYTGHAPAWSPDGKRLALVYSLDEKQLAAASGMVQDVVLVWDVAKGRLLTTCIGHAESVFTVAWSPDGKRLASGGAGGEVFVWDAASAKYLSIYMYSGLNSRIITVVAWSPDGRRLASGGPGETVEVWDAATRQTLATYRGHKSMVNAIAWSPDRRRIASGSGLPNYVSMPKDQTVQIWDAAIGEQLFTYQGHSNMVTSVSWSPGGRRLASGSLDGTVQVWSAG
jgi:WD40 repeat protein